MSETTATARQFGHALHCVFVQCDANATSKRSSAVTLLSVRPSVCHTHHAQCYSEIYKHYTANLPRHSAHHCLILRFRDENPKQSLSADCKYLLCVKDSQLGASIAVCRGN